VELLHWRVLANLGSIWCRLWTKPLGIQKGSLYSTAERRVPELVPVLGSHPASDASHKPDGRLPLLSARPAVTPTTLKRAATNFASWWTEAQWVWTVCLRLYWTASRLRFEPRPLCAWVQHANYLATKPPWAYKPALFGWIFLVVPAHPGSPGQGFIKQWCV